MATSVMSLTATISMSAVALVGDPKDRAADAPEAVDCDASGHGISLAWWVQVWTSLCSSAYWTSSARLDRLSLCWMCARWVSTVRTER